MPRKIFVNLPVKDLPASVDFFTKLGFQFNPRFTEEHAACMVVGEDAFVMLLVEPFFRGFTSKQVVDATTHTEAILAVSADRREDVDALVTTALAIGGRHAADPIADGPMYGWSFEDLDGHLWEVIHMDPVAVES